MKKNFVLSLSTILLSIGLLVGCSDEPEEPGFEEDQIQNENSEQGEIEVDPPVTEEGMDEGTNEGMNEGMDEGTNEGTTEGTTDGTNEDLNGETLNEEPDETEQP